MIGFITVFSDLTTKKELKDYLKSKLLFQNEFKNDLKFSFFIDVLNEEDKKYDEQVINSDIDGLVFFIGSGGVEKKVLEIYNKCQKPILLIANHEKNSLAASLEIYSYLKEDNLIDLFYSDWNNEEIINKIKNFILVLKGITALDTAKLGVIGEPSFWLLNSQNFKIPENIKFKIIKIEINELINEVNKINLEKSEKIVNDWQKKFKEINVSYDDMVNSAKVYLAMKNIKEKYGLTSCTIRCFDLLNYNYTACMGMALCNDENFVSACEGDIQAAITMEISSLITDNPVWMANPSVINKKENTVLFAHCTIATKMITDISTTSLISHMESDKSVAIRGKLKNGKVTIARLSKNFDKLLAISGEIIDSDFRYEKLCRTQALIKFDKPIEKWLDNILGNHQIIIYDDIIDTLKDICKYKGIRFIEI